MFKNSDFDQPIVDWIDKHAIRGYVVTDASLTICGWNRWLEEKSGISAEAVMGRKISEAFPDLVARQLDRLYENALSGQVSVLAQRFHKYLLKFPASPEYDLTEMQQTAYIAPLLRDEKVIGTISVIDDVSERIFRENELLAAREEALAANQAKDRFIAMLSHDLRTPLTAILGWTRVFQDRSGDPRIILKGVEAIERNAAVQLRLIEEVLDISRISSAKLELTLEPTDICAAVDSALEAVEHLAQAKSIQIQRPAPPEERRTALLDAKRFQQVIWNLLSNAIKFTPKGGVVMISLEYSADEFQLSVADTGKGVSSENLPHLFEPLWQAEGSHGYGGLGLGLAIAKKMVDLHGGSIRAESVGLGQGTAFFVRMPWKGPRATPAKELMGSMPAGQGK
jgi:PAS domain S-box-containing protein